MTNGEKTECPFCGAQAERSPFSDETDPSQPVSGWKYRCPNCGPFILAENEHSWIENDCSQDQKLMVFEYLRDNPPEEGDYKVLTSDELKKIIQQSPPDEL